MQSLIIIPLISTKWKCFKASLCVLFSLSVSLCNLHTHVWLCIVLNIYHSSYLFICPLNFCVVRVCVGGGILPLTSSHHYQSLPISLLRVSLHMNWHLSVSIINLLIWVYVCHFCSAQVSVCDMLFPVLSSNPLPSNLFHLLCHFVSAFFILHCSFYSLCADIFSNTHYLEQKYVLSVFIFESYCILPICNLKVK